MMARKYYHLTLEVTPYACRPLTEHVVISEDPLEWQERDDKHEPVGGCFVRILQYREISEETYKKHKKNNPYKPGKPGDRYDPPSCRDFLMADADYAKCVAKQRRAA